MPLTGGSIACAVAAYQLFGDIVPECRQNEFRAAATMDANGFRSPPCCAVAGSSVPRSRSRSPMECRDARRLPHRWSERGRPAPALVAEIALAIAGVCSAAFGSSATAADAGRLGVACLTAGALLLPEDTGPALGWDGFCRRLVRFDRRLSRILTTWIRARLRDDSIASLVRRRVSSFPLIVGDCQFSRLGASPGQCAERIRHNLAELARSAA
jgi:hypothetical protein